MSWRGSHLLLALVLVAFGCSDDGGLSRPTPVETFLAEPAPSSGNVTATILTFISGETGRPVSGATVVLGGQGYETDAAGQVAIPDLAAGGIPVDVTAEGFLERRTRTGRGESTFFELWPDDSPTRLDAVYTRTLVYASAGVGTEGELEPLERPGVEKTRVAVNPSPGILRDGRALDTIYEAVSAMNEALGGAILYQVGEDPAAMPVELRIDPSDELLRDGSSRALTRCWRRGLAITRCEILYRSIDIADSETTLHELGHTLGLNHSPDRSEIMGVHRIRSPRSFSPRERLAMRLMLKRRPGNLYPDNDRSAPSLRALPEESAIVCAHPD